MKEIWKHCGWLQNVPQHKQKSKFDQDESSSSSRKMQKTEENFETLQLAVEFHSMDKNQSLIKIRPVVPEKNAKKWRKFGNVANGCKVPEHKQKSKIDQDQTSSSLEKCKKVKKICETLQLATECHSMKQKSKFDQDQASSSFRKMQKSEKILKLYNWL